jgi:short subunit dehydrogenase-like uncharacterized protein
MPAQLRYDIVLFGAAGFTGTLTAEYLAAHAPTGMRWALAGRNQAKLERLRSRLSARNPSCARLPLLYAEADDAPSLGRLAAASRVVIATVGPYIVHGEPLVAACAQAGTDYVDIAGESEFVDLMYIRHHQQAMSTGARIVHCCGFDSIPYDLGAYFTVKHLPETVPIRLEAFAELNVEGRLTERFSGGSMRSALVMFSRPRQRLRAARIRRALEPRPTGRRIRALLTMPRYERSLRALVLPVPTIDSQVVRRSAAALRHYGPAFSYGQYLVMDRSAAGMIVGVAAAFSVAQIAPARRMLLARARSGMGPTLIQREGRRFKLRFMGEGGGDRVVTEVSGGDPGYGEASKMLAESALSLACDDLSPTSGQVTSAVAMGEALIERLRGAGISFAVLDPP